MTTMSPTEILHDADGWSFSAGQRDIRMTNDSKNGRRELDKDATISVLGGAGTILQDQEVPPKAY